MIPRVANCTFIAAVCSDIHFVWVVEASYRVQHSYTCMRLEWDAAHTRPLIM